MLQLHATKRTDVVKSARRPWVHGWAGHAGVLVVGAAFQCCYSWSGHLVNEVDETAGGVLCNLPAVAKTCEVNQEFFFGKDLWFLNGEDLQSCIHAWRITACRHVCQPGAYAL